MGGSFPQLASTPLSYFIADCQAIFGCPSIPTTTSVKLQVPQIMCVNNKFGVFVYIDSMGSIGLTTRGLIYMASYGAVP